MTKEQRKFQTFDELAFLAERWDTLEVQEQGKLLLGICEAIMLLRDVLKEKLK